MMSSFILAALCVFALILVVVFGFINYKSQFNENEDEVESYSFLNCFPYEMQDNPKMKYSLIFRLAASLLGASIAVFGIYQFLIEFIYKGILIHNIILALLFIINGLSIFLLNVLTMKNYKAHLVFASLLFVLTILLNFYLGYFVIIDLYEMYHEVYIYIFFIIGVTLLISIFVTPLKKWMYLAKVEKDGEISYKRKRIAILPIMEWIFIFVNILLCIIISFM